jgi:hypothetical protein
MLPTPIMPVLPKSLRTSVEVGAGLAVEIVSVVPEMV